MLCHSTGHLPSDSQTTFLRTNHVDLFVTRYFELMTREVGVHAGTVEEVKHRLFSTEYPRV